MKCFTCTALLAAATLVCAASTAVAGHPKTQIKLYPPSDSPFPRASGTVRLYASSRPPAASTISVSVSKLAPNTVYYMPVYIRDYWVWYDPGWGWRWEYSEGPAAVSIQTDAHGDGGGSLSADEIYPEGSPFEVIDLQTGTLALSPQP